MNSINNKAPGAETEDDDVFDEEIFKCEHSKECVKGNRLNLTICPESPCPLNMTRFGTHERAIDYYLTIEDWDSAYYYFKNLISGLHINCDIEKYDQYRSDIDSAPPGCRVFLLSDKLKTAKTIINEMELGRDLGEMSITAENSYEASKKEFVKNMNKCMEILTHLSKDFEYNSILTEDAHQRYKELYLLAEKAKKEGLEVGTQMDNTLEKAFENAALVAYSKLTPRKEKMQNTNAQKIEDAKTAMENATVAAELTKTKKELFDEIKKEMANGKKFTQQEIEARMKDELNKRIKKIKR